MKLYHDNPYQQRFQAQIITLGQIDGRPAVVLDQTAFYPTGGGQPHDTGRLNEAAVIDVQNIDGQVWHLLDRPLETGPVQGEIDWPRRWDFMQNHSGQHVLTRAFIETAGAGTVGWHLSDNSVTIDLNRNDLSDDELARAEGLAQQVIQENRTIRDYLVSQADLPALKLRKKPDIDGPLRIVDIDSFDQVACGGLHVSSSSQIGMLKILRLERRGSEARIHFACGGRAVADYGRKHDLIRKLAAQFSRNEEELLEAVDKLQAESKANYKALKATRNALVEAEAARLWSQIAARPAPRLLGRVYPDWEPEQVKRLALSLRERPGCFIALAGGDPPQMVFARSEDLDLNAGQLLRQALAQVGGRGGGRPDVAQGRAPDIDAARQAIDAAILMANC